MTSWRRLLDISSFWTYCLHTDVSFHFVIGRSLLNLSILMKPKFYFPLLKCETLMKKNTNLLIVPKRISGVGIPVHDEKSLDTPARMYQFPFDLSLHPIKK